MITGRLKRLLVLGGFFVIVLGIAIALYFVFFRGIVAGPSPIIEETVGETGIPVGLPSAEQAAEQAEAEAEAEEEGLPVSEIAEGGLTETTRLTSGSVLSPTLAADGQSIVYYDPNTGQFYKINEEGEPELLSEATFPDAETIVWSDAAEEVVIEFPDGSNVVYDFVTEQQTTLPTHWEDFDFSPDGEQVIAKNEAIDPNARSLVITNADASQTQVIAALGENGDKVDIAWSPNDQVVAFSATGTSQTGFGRKMIVPIGKNEENYNGLIVEGINFNAIWSPDGKRILYDVTGEVSDYKPLLWIVDGTAATMGDDRSSLGVNTWVEKCTFADNETVYCGVPVFLSANAGLQPGLNDTDDALYSININTGRVRLVGIPEITTSMSHLNVSEDGSLLYYTDSRGRLQFMRLR